ncbi:uncharacterized protein C31H12.03c [Cimex lectularius]|uniref:SAP domain-containing protein n=1 Tax=Cimex lectularius TaxID=79782 RepID=A0A8I6S5Q9_CIMLE|nr:uncharacterized protein C31H12.03c [Cimex lectularius]
MSDAGPEESTDYTKMKVPDLKKLLKSRGLSTAGNKQELIDRLQSSEAAAEALLEGSEVGDHFDEDLERELDETPLEDSPQKLGDAPDLTAEDIKQDDVSKSAADGKPDSAKDNKTELEDKHVKVNLKNVALSDAARKKARAERFGSNAKAVPADVLAQRVEKFGPKPSNSTLTKQADSTTSIVTTTQAKATTPTSDVLKRRAERFGILSPVEAKRQHLEKLQARKMRFSQTPASTDTKPTTTTLATAEAVTVSTPVQVDGAISSEERKRLRAQRFKITV